MRLSCLTLLVALAALAPVPASATKGPVEVDAEVVLAVDVSYSMDDNEQHLQRGGYIAALTSPEFAKALESGPHGKIAVAYMEWASYEDQRVVVGWTLIDGPEAAKAFADKLGEATYRRARRTSISGAIDASMKLFEGNGYSGIRRVIDVSGDGPNNNGRPVAAAREEAVRQGVTINGLPLVDIRPYLGYADIENLDVYYEDCVIGGAGAFMVPVRGAQAFVDATRTKLVLEIAGLTPPRAPRVMRASTAAPRVSCTIGENLWNRRMGN